MTVRRSTYEDIPRLMDIYVEARGIQLASGNLHQWKEGYPSEEVIRGDIDKGVSHLIEEDGSIIGAFAFILGKDPTYGYVQGGAWIEDSSPYATIHRLGSTRDSHGVAGTCFEWCWNQIRNLRIDTHEDNAIMRHCIEKFGFRFCGTIFLQNGEPRLAYQKTE